MGVLSNLHLTRTTAALIVPQPVRSGVSVVGTCVFDECPSREKLVIQGFGEGTVHVPELFTRARCAQCQQALAPTALVLRECRARGIQHRPVESEEYFSLAEDPSEILIMATSPTAVACVLGHKALAELTQDDDFHLPQNRVLTFVVEDASKSTCVVA